MSVYLPDQNTKLEFYPSQYTPEQIEVSIGKGPIIQNGTWWVWNVETGAYQDTGIYATIAPGSVTTDMLSDSSVTWPKLAPEVQLDHRNLLDNWYFVGGGSQQGGGQFPINQRGLTEYTGDYVYSIDRWKINNIKYNVSNNIITITGSPEHAKFFQLIENGLPQNNMLYTFSFLSSSGLHSVTSDLSADTWVDIPYGKLILWHDGICEVRFDKSAIGDEITPIAAKLELGPVQTLAHQDANGNWVLNDPPPNMALELEKCQLYYGKDTVYLSNTMGSDGWVMYNLSFPHMRATPTVTATVFETDASGNLVVRRVSPSNMLLALTTSGRTTGDSIYWYGTIERSADL